MTRKQQQNMLQEDSNSGGTIESHPLIPRISPALGSFIGYSTLPEQAPSSPSVSNHEKGSLVGHVTTF